MHLVQAGVNLIYIREEREVASLQGLLLDHDSQAAARRLRPVNGS
jgi:hypothetical protein